MEPYEFVKLYDWNAWAFPIDLIILTHRNGIWEHTDISHGLFCTLLFGRIVLTHAIVVKDMIHFETRLILTFDIDTVDE